MLTNRQTIETFLAEYDDDVEDEKEKDEWYFDRDRWIEKRRIHRDRERMWDERGRNREEADLKRAEEGLAPVDRTQEDEAEKEDASTKSHDVITARKLIPLLRDLLKTKLPFFNPLDPSSMNTQLLYSHSIRWPQLTKPIMKRKLVPLIDKAINNFLGDSEPELVEFIVDAVTPKEDSDVNPVSPQSLLDEIIVVFGDGDEERKEAEKLVSDVWRSIVWETEKLFLVAGRNVVGLEEGDIIDLEPQEIL